MKTRGGFPCYVYFNSENCSGGGECIKCCRLRPFGLNRENQFTWWIIALDAVNVSVSVPMVASSLQLLRWTVINGWIRFRLYLSHLFFTLSFRGFTRMMFLRASGLWGSHMPWICPGFLNVTCIAQGNTSLKRRGGGNLDFPVLSAMCPVVLRLIAFRFPDLIENLNPMMRPVSILVKYALSCIANLHKVELKDLSVFTLIHVD